MATYKKAIGCQKCGGVIEFQIYTQSGSSTGLRFERVKNGRFIDRMGTFGIECRNKDDRNRTCLNRIELLGVKHF